MNIFDMLSKEDLSNEEQNNFRTKSLDEFFKNEYTSYASYDNARKIGNIIDGLKLSSRKVIYTILTNNIKDEVKVSQLASKTSEQTEYLHGEKSLEGVIVGLAQDYAGTNNLPLLYPEGNFGKRFIPAASASRYIYTHMQNYLRDIFLKEDDEILENHKFEGRDIEFKYYVPTIPILLVNGSEGISNGFAQKILPRNINDIIENIKLYLKENKINKLLPYYKNFEGSILDKGNNKYEILGKFEWLSNTKLLITEIPIGISLKAYQKILDSLEEKKIIKSYKDLSSKGDKFRFEIIINSNWKNYDDYKILDKLKLIKKVTENLTFNNEFNKIETFDNIEDILKYYIEFKLKYIEKRKQNQLKKINEEIRSNQRIVDFINLIVNNKVDIRNKEEDIIKVLEEYNLEKIENSYDYLFRIPIKKLNKNERDKLDQKIKLLFEEYDILNRTSPKDIWLNDLKNLQNKIG